MRQPVICFAILSLFFCSSVFARKQGQERTDSLVQELPKQKEDTNKVKLLGELSKIYSNADPDASIRYGSQELETATKLGWKKGIAQANCDLGIVYQVRSDMPKAFEYLFKALAIDEEIGNKLGVAAVTCNIANGYNFQSNYPLALDYYFKALKMDRENGFSKYEAIVTSNIGTIYMDNKDYTKALEYFFTASGKYDELGMKPAAADVNGNIGNIYYLQHNNDKALEYYLKALEIAEQTGALQNIANTRNNIGQVYAAQRNYALAHDYYQSALATARKIDAKDLVALSITNIGLLYLMADTSTTSYVAADHSGELNKKSFLPGPGQPSMPATKAGLLAASMQYLQDGLALSKEINAQQFMQECYEGLTAVYRLSGDYKKALESVDNYLAIKDSVFSKENSENIIKLGMKNEYDQQRLADSLKIAAKEKVTDLKLQRQRTYTIMGIASVLLLAGFSFFISRERARSEKERKKSDELLLNILPAEVAGELKINGSTKARQFENVTILFTDFVNFTLAAERMSPQSLIDELHTCFKEFDRIIGKYNMEKIKTIGDAYLAVCGLPVGDPMHAENVIHAAIEIKSFMIDRLAKLGISTFEVRIGINTGSVVSGIVGVKKFAFDIWGDAVNIAARIEQNGEAGRINVSETTYELVKDKFSFEYRGEISAKNKGMMKMYFVAE